MSYLLAFSAAILHISLILFRGYFLTPEYTLYPYLISNGFIPYKNLIDQHFPALFSPFSFPAFMTNNQWPLLGLFLITLCLTDLFLYLALIKRKIKKPLVWTVFFIVSSVYFAGYILWIETFVNFLLSLFFLISSSKKKNIYFVSGFLLSQIILLRPTIAPALFFLIISLSSITPLMFLGGVIGLILPLILVYRLGVVNEFLDLTIRFNQSVYPIEAKVLPMFRQLLEICFWAIPPILSFLYNKKYFYIITTIFLCLLGYPRFGFEHLQPLILSVVFLYAISETKPGMVVYFFIIIFFCLSLIKSIRYSYGNYYLSPEIVKTSELIKEIPGREVYLLGPSDLLYQLSGKIPPNRIYVPSLPWYLHQSSFKQAIIESLEISKPPVIVDLNARVDNMNIASESGEIIEYVKMNYTNTGMVGGYQLYIPKL